MTPNRRTPPKPAQTKLQDIPADAGEDQPVEGSPVPAQDTAVLDEAKWPTVADLLPPATVPAADPWSYDTFAVLSSGGQNFLDGPVPVRKVLFTGPLVQWLSTGACPWGDMDDGHLVLRLSNITLEFAVGETLDDGSVVLTPGAHLWSDTAAWVLASDGTETAMPRG